MNSSTSDFPRPFRASQAQAILPRSASLALWIARVGSGAHSAEEAVASVQHIDEPHIIDDASGSIPLVTFLRACVGRVVASAAAFPIPGDIASAPYLATYDGVEAEELVLLRLRAQDNSTYSIALVPQISEFGPAGDRGYITRWHRIDIEPWELQFLASAGSLPEAQRALRIGLAKATEALVDLDVARWHDDHADLIDLLRDSVNVEDFLPPDVSTRVYSIIESAARLRAIVDLARFTDGAALGAAQASARLRLLRDVDSIARRAMEAATLLSPLLPD